jgi:Uma2 family endonuclease
MAEPAHRVNYSLADYLALEESSSVKHEFLDGQIYGMAGGTPEHAALKAAVTGLLFSQLKGTSCRLYDADLRVRVQQTGLLTYPDVTVACGPLERDAGDANAIVNPRLLVEVTSRSTEEYDRGDKFEHYKRIPSLREYLLVSHSSCTIELWRREADGAWSQLNAGAGEAMELRSVGATLTVDELYAAAGI